MIKVLEEFSGDILGFVVSAAVTEDDYKKTIIPAVDKALEEYNKLRVYAEFSSSLESVEPAAIWEDFKLGMGHFTSWEKIAIVTDIVWLKNSIAFLSFMFPCEVKIFSLAEAFQAKIWVRG